MDKKQAEKRTKRLFALWITLFFLFSIGTSVYMSVQEVFYGINLKVMPNGFQFFSIAVIALFFIPLLGLVHKRAKESDSAKLYAITHKLLWLLGIASCCALLANIIACFAPDFFHS